MPSYHNTTLEQFKEQEHYEQIAKDQERIILDFAKLMYNSSFSSEDAKCLFPYTVPLTTIRRAICNLKKSGNLVITGKTKGEYGRNIFLYRWNL